jgi:putative nucleotidyltransferase with HDIG domain
MQEQQKIPQVTKKSFFKRQWVKYVQLAVFSLAVAFLIKLTYVGFSGFADAMKDGVQLRQVFALAGILAIIIFLLYFYIAQSKKELLENKRLVGVLMLSIALTLVVSILFGNAISIAIMPLALSGLLISILIDRRVGLTANFLINLGFFFTFTMIFGIEGIMATATAMLAGIVSGTYMILMMEKTYTRMKFLLNGLFISFCMAPVAMLIAAFINYSLKNVLYAGLWTMFSVLLSVSLFITVLPAFEKLFKLTTNFGLEELCSFDTKLLKRLSEEAPGTFNHSLAVGNLAQLCALAIGENPQLAKAAAYYHDVGKLKDPLCYVENQKGYNPHDDFIPEVSVYVITQHTKWGYDLLKKEHIPDAIANIALEHHGTTYVNYFYNKVKKLTEDSVERKDFSYGGPIPSSKVSAIIMIADTVEAATRAQGISADPAVMRAFVHKLIDEKHSQGQFDNSNITFKQLKKIEDTLVEALPGVFHNRIAYDDKK